MFKTCCKFSTSASYLLHQQSLDTEVVEVLHCYRIRCLTSQQHQKLYWLLGADMKWLFTCKTLHNSEIWFGRLTNPGFDSDSDTPYWWLYCITRQVLNAFQQHCKYCHIVSHVSCLTLQQNKKVKISHAILLNKSKSDLIFKFWAKYSLNSFLPPCLTWGGSIDSFIAFFGYIKVNTLVNSEIYRAICCQQNQVNQKS